MLEDISYISMILCQLTGKSVSATIQNSVRIISNAVHSE